MENFRNYVELLNSLKARIRQSQVTAAFSVNLQLLTTYWDIGKTILDYQQMEGWGARVVERLAKDLKEEFPDMKGFSIRNFRYMRSFAEAFPFFPWFEWRSFQSDENQKGRIVQAPLAQLSWFHHLTLLEKVKDPGIREFYIRKAIENGWSRNVMVHQIDRGLHLAQGSLSTNFHRTIQSPDSELVQQVFKDPYCFDFLQLDQKVRERDLEKAILHQIQKVLLELGQGFAFVGNQFRLEIGGQEYFLDLLFYHTKLRRYIVIELKTGEFVPEFAGKMNFYLGLVDDELRGQYDLPAIGIILCKQNNKFIAEYALRDTSKPIGIAEYLIGEALPPDIRSELPTIEELEVRLEERMLQGTPRDRMQFIKEKLKAMKTEECQTRLNQQVIEQLLDLSLSPLTNELIVTLKAFDEDYVSQIFEWRIANLKANEWKTVVQFFTNNTSLIEGQTLNLSVIMEGLRKSGINHSTHQADLKIAFNQFTYEISLSNYNNNLPFLKKLYHQSLTQNERSKIIDLVMNDFLDQIDCAIEQMKGNRRS